MFVQTVKVPTDELMQIVLLQLKNGGVATLTVTGFSMMPMLRNMRDAVILIPVSRALEPGEIALFQRDNGRYVLHRVIKVTGEGYLFCGDNQAELEPVRHDQLMALVNGFTRKGKTHSLTEYSYQLYTTACIRLFCLRRSYIAIRRSFGHIGAWFSNRRKRK